MLIEACGGAYGGYRYDGSAVVDATSDGGQSGDAADAGGDNADGNADGDAALVATDP
jgi:hypothetical protein